MTTASPGITHDERPVTRGFPSTRDLVALTKPRLASLVLWNTAGGLWLAGARFRTANDWNALIGTTLAVAGAHVLNGYIERDTDALMNRTRNRPLPAGRVEPGFALAMGVILSVVSVPWLWVGTNPLTAMLGALALVSYVAVYTPMKTRSPWALWVGALPGALPPLMGYTAFTGRIAAPGLALFGVLFLWQLPHFLAIALMGKDDYARASIRTVVAVHGEAVARRQIVATTAVLIPVSLSFVPLGVAGYGYGAAALALGLWFLAVGVRGLRGNRAPTETFRASLVYLTGLFLALMLGAR